MRRNRQRADSLKCARQRTRVDQHRALPLWIWTHISESYYVRVRALRTLDTAAPTLLLRVVGNELAEPPRKLESRCEHGVSKRHRAKYERTSVQGEWNLG